MPEVETGSLKSSGRVCKKSEQIVSRFGMEPKKNVRRSLQVCNVRPELQV